MFPKAEKRPFLEDFLIKFRSIAWSDKESSVYKKLKDELWHYDEFSEDDFHE